MKRFLLLFVSCLVLALVGCSEDPKPVPGENGGSGGSGGSAGAPTASGETSGAFEDSEVASNRFQYNFKIVDIEKFNRMAASAKILSVDGEVITVAEFAYSGKSETAAYGTVKVLEGDFEQDQIIEVSSVKEVQDTQGRSISIVLGTDTIVGLGINRLYKSDEPFSWSEVRNTFKGVLELVPDETEPIIDVAESDSVAAVDANGICSPELEKDAKLLYSTLSKAALEMVSTAMDVGIEQFGRDEARVELMLRQKIKAKLEPAIRACDEFKAKYETFACKTSEGIQLSTAIVEDGCDRVRNADI